MKEVQLKTKEWREKHRSRRKAKGMDMKAKGRIERKQRSEREPYPEIGSGLVAKGRSQVTRGEDASTRARLRSPHDPGVTLGSATCSGLESSKLRGVRGCESWVMKVARSDEEWGVGKG